MRSLHFAAVVVAVALLPAIVGGQAGRTQRVAFKPGAASASVRGTIRGDEFVDYVLGAKAGQIMTLTLKTTRQANYFNVLPPGSDAAIAIGSTLGHKWTGTLPADGDYTVRVYLMRSAARRNESAAYTLTIGITGWRDPVVAGTPYHATGTVPCSVGTDPRGSSRCSFGVIRRGGGQADVYLAQPGDDVTLHRDRLRILRFTADRITSADAKEQVTFEKHGDDWLVAVNDFYYYTIPEAVVLGG